MVMNVGKGQRDEGTAHRRTFAFPSRKVNLEGDLVTGPYKKNGKLRNHCENMPRSDCRHFQCREKIDCERRREEELNKVRNTEY